MHKDGLKRPILFAEEHSMTMLVELVRDIFNPTESQASEAISIAERQNQVLALPPDIRHAA